MSAAVSTETIETPSTDLLAPAITGLEPSTAASLRATFVPFQAMFDEAVKYAPPAHWAGDGVHPTAAGASLMAHNWLRIVTGKSWN